MEDVPGGADRLVPYYLVGASGVLTLVVLAEIIVHFIGGTAPTNVVTPNEFLVGVVTTAPFIAGLGYGGYWLDRSDVSPDRYRRVGYWCLAGTVGFLLINLALVAVMPVTTLVFVGWVRWAVAFGAGVGVLIGIIEARAIESALAAERTAMRAEHLEAQRDLLDYLNSLLRHEVLNAVNVIGGFASMLVEEHEPGERHHEFGETIHRQSEDMTRVIQDVRVLLNAWQGDTEFRPVDLSEVLRDELRKLTESADDVRVDADLPEAVYVRGDPLVARVFGNLLANAVEHNDGTAPFVRVSVERTDDTVVVTVSDDGPGLPDEVVETLFERPQEKQGDHGLGLYLVGRLVDYYGGDIELTETGPEGSVFTVGLPRAETAASDPSTAEWGDEWPPIDEGPTFDESPSLDETN